MKNVFDAAIRGGSFDLSTMLSRINYHHILGSLTDAEREELIIQARTQAKAAAGMDVTQKLLELDARITALEKAGTTSADEAAEYVPGKWYYQGDKVLFGGSTYTCIAPSGAVCTWSPEEYPAYWEQN